MLRQFLKKRQQMTITDFDDKVEFNPDEDDEQYLDIYKQIDDRRESKGDAQSAIGVHEIILKNQTKNVWSQQKLNQA